MKAYFKESKGYDLLPANRFHRKMKVRDNHLVGDDAFIFETKIKDRKYPIRIMANEIGDVLKWDWILPPNTFVDMRDIV